MRSDLMDLLMNDVIMRKAESMSPKACTRWL
jgi:hypothetical protein